MRGAALALLVVAALCAGPARAQLLSPGPLTRVHAGLEGIRNCTQCHQLGRRGVDPTRCLTCHAPIAERIRERRGLHGRQSERDCGSCHSDHHGREFDSARFSTTGFDHAGKTGFALVGQHRAASCRSCHTPAFVTDAGVRRSLPANRLDDTFLGTSTACLTCHADENPHSRAVATTCQTCHTPADWNRIDAFDHAQTGFRLTGGHARAACTGCHGAEGRGAARFRAIPDACESCHTSDNPVGDGAANPHGTQFRGQTCASCHTTVRWAGADAFSHARTAFPLAGSHARLDCARCHGSGRAAQFAGVSARCLTCHASDSPHGSQFAGRECDSCHGPETWASAPAFSHDRTRFPLVGLHARVDCAGCHATEGGRQQFAGVDAATCQSCHEDAHDGALGADCATCHAPTGWTRIAGAGASALADRFEHEVHTGFALVGAHQTADCGSCHGMGRAPDGFARRDDDFHIALAGAADGATFPALATDGTCLACHADAHDGQLADLPTGADCSSCHGQDAFAPATFDRARHDAEAGFALVGAHAVVPCGACHTRRRDAPPNFDAAAACQSCHADDSPHGDQFDGPEGTADCADCHATETWSAAAFDHDARTGFALTGAHAAADCATCHARPADPSASWSFAGLAVTCASCHVGDDPHAGQFDGPGGASDCATCHDTSAFTLARFDHERTAFPLAGAHASVACASCHREERGTDGTMFTRFKPLPTACASCHAGR